MTIQTKFNKGDEIYHISNFSIKKDVIYCIHYNHPNTPRGISYSVTDKGCLTNRSILDREPPVTILHEEYIFASIQELTTYYENKLK